MLHSTKSKPKPFYESLAKSESFQSFGLAGPLLRGLEASGFCQPTEIQSRAIPVAMDGRDLMASAQTGTGKTAAFVLPAMQRLLTAQPKPGRGPRVLVLTPTRELAGQVEQVIRQLGRFARLRSGIIVGGLSYGPQERLLRNELDLLVATPGRLIDHMEQGRADFSRLELFVLDEADRMLDMGFVKPVTRIAEKMPTDRQTLLFSATLEGDVHKIAGRLLNDPVRISLATAKVRHEAITQRLHLTDSPEHKNALLRRLLDDPTMTQAIVFTATKRGADRLAKRLASHGHACAPLHGNMRQGARQRTVDSLRSGKVRILVATDVAARGIDLLGVSHVINFDLPAVAEDYIHRIGRTGRNGATGTAISLVGSQDRIKLANIERLTGYRMERQESAMPAHLVATSPGDRQPSQRPLAASGTNGNRPHRRSQQRPSQRPLVTSGTDDIRPHRRPSQRPLQRRRNNRLRARV
ncbi:MAG: DEAD/DEAH box helicase [SAR324 cluster bacterium]|nr:DEAD/DEAH box helicase [SAR324 cluster bacterium]